MGNVIAIRPRRKLPRLALKNLALMIEHKQTIEAAIRALEEYQRLSTNRQSPEDAGRVIELPEIRSRCM